MTEARLVERRAHERVDVAHAVIAWSLAGDQLPIAKAINASMTSMLVAFPEPVGLFAGDRLKVSVSLPTGRLHSLARVRRVERGRDLRSYVGFTFIDMAADEAIRFSTELNAERRFLHVAAADTT